MSMNRRPWFGAFLVVLGAIFFSSKAVIVKLAYQFEVDPISLLTLRFLFSLPIFLVVAYRARRRRTKSLTRTEKIQIVVFGVAGYYLASLLDFLGLQFVPASIERLLLFAYPTFVVLISGLVLKQPVKRIQWLALMITYIGIGVTFAEGVYLSDEPKFLLGAALVMLCALTYAIYLVGSGHLLPKLGTWRYTSLAMSAACVAILIHHFIAYRWDLWQFPMPVYGLSVLMALIATVLPVFMISEGIRLIGASNAAILGSVGPVSTIILASIFLGESLGGWQWAGAALVIFGVVLIASQKRSAVDAPRSTVDG